MILIDIIFFVNLYLLFSIKKKKIEDRFKDLFVRSYWDVFNSIIINFLFFFVFFLFFRVYKFFIHTKNYVDVKIWLNFAIETLSSFSFYGKIYVFFIILFLLFCFRLFYYLVFCFFKFHFLRLHFFFLKNHRYLGCFRGLCFCDIFLRRKFGYYYFFFKNYFLKMCVVFHLFYYFFFQVGGLFYIGYVNYFAMYYFLIGLFNFVSRFVWDFDEGMRDFYSSDLSITSGGLFKLRLYSLYLVFNNRDYFFVPSYAYNFNYEYPRNWVFFNFKILK